MAREEAKEGELLGHVRGEEVVGKEGEEEEEAVWNCFLYLVELVQLLLPSSYVEVDCYKFLGESQPYLKFF